MNIISVLTSILRDITDAPTLASLRDIRRILDDPVLVFALQEHIRQINDPERLSETFELLSNIRRLTEERTEDRKYEKDQIVQIGVVGGIGLIGGTIVAAASSVAPFIVLVPILGGGFMAVTGFLSGRKLNQEHVVYGQIANRMNHIVTLLHPQEGRGSV